MAFADNITLHDNSGNAQVFARIVAPLDTGIRRMADFSDSVAPVYLDVRHKAEGSGQKTRDRHNITLSATMVDTSGSPVTILVSTTLVVPRNAVITPEMVRDTVAYQTDFVTGGGFSIATGFADDSRVNSIIRGEA